MARGGLPAPCQVSSPDLKSYSQPANNFLALGVDFFKNLLYTLRIESERRMRTEQELQEEQRRAEARVQRWNESVRQVRELARQWQRDNAHLGPFLHPVEDEESWRKFLTFLRISGILFVMKMKDTLKTFTVETEDRYGRLGDYTIEAPTLELATAKAKSANHYIFDIKEK